MSKKLLQLLKLFIDFLGIFRREQINLRKSELRLKNQTPTVSK